MAKRRAKRRRGKKRDEYLLNGSVIFWSQRFKDRRERRRVPVRCGQCGLVREISTGRARREDFTGLCQSCAQMRTEDQVLANGSVVLWSKREEEQVPVRCGMCGRVREATTKRAYKSNFTGLCRACAWGYKTEDEVLANGSVVLWSKRGEGRVPVRCGMCGQVHEVNENSAQSSGFVGLCHACASAWRKIHIPRRTLEHLYNELGLTAAEIGDQLGCSKAPVLKRMEECGLERRPPANVSQTLVPAEVLHWSSNLAYIVGMIATDGNLAQGCSKVVFGSTDYQWIETYQDLLRTEATMYVTPPQKPGRKMYYSVAISDPDYRAFLEGVGLMPAKTKERTLGPLDVPDAYFRDFLRACIDGDGGIYDYKGLRVEIFSVCRPFLAWIGETVERLIGLPSSGLYSKPGGRWMLAYYSSKAQRLLRWVYYAPDLPCLERKREVWEMYQAKQASK
ncbi:MAG: hypothetical protein ISS49_04940 [Anaerolineae bacterium]|nr:hypothetical protein [Anaerolineae bacterium]